MRILVTGGTGLVGSQATAALVGAGHEVRLLVRSPDKVGPLYEQLGLDIPPHVAGDVCDAASVAAALEGCDAVLHAASVYSHDSRAAAEMERINAPGTRIVLEEAARRGVERVVYVSSTVAFLPGPGTGLVGPDSPVGDPAAPYARTKADAERVARAAQERGEPVAIVYPGGVYGPGDPYLGEQMLLVRELVRRRLPVVPSGGFPAVDVRDVSAVITAMFTGPANGRRLIVPGRHRSVAQIAAELAEVTGRRLVLGTMPAGMFAPAARIADRLQRFVPPRLPVSSEPIYVLRCDTRYDHSATRTELGIEPRPFTETLADTVAWLLKRGLIRPRHAGAVAAREHTGPLSGATV